MKSNNPIKQTCAVLVTLLLAYSGNSFSLSGGIIGHSGNPATNSGNNCTLCHTGGSAPTVSINGPGSVEAGSANLYTLTMSGGQQNTAGVNIGTSGGTLSSTSTNIVIEGGELRHSQPLNVGTSPGEWSFQLQAPVTAGTITLYASALSANDDSQMAGDNSTSVSLTITVTTAQKKLVPAASFSSPAFATPNELITLDAGASTDGDGNITRYLWDFGDGSAFVQGAVVSHAYNAEGSYTVTLAATDDDGLTGAIAATITIASDTGSAQGAALYNQFCFACHGTGGIGGSASPITGISIDNVTTAIGAIAVMQSINLTAEEIQLIVDFLNGGGGSEPPPRPADGPGLYAMFCAACHGADARGGSAIGVTGAPLAMISAAITEVQSMQNIELSVEETQLIANFLTAGGGGAVPQTGGELYSVFCAVCHGQGGHGGKYFAVTGASNPFIADAINNIPWMQSLSLSDSQLTLIGDYLGAGGSPPLPFDDKGLYDTFCAVCHGTGGHGGNFKAVTGTSSEMLQEAINNEPWMSSLQLTQNQQQQIAGYLSNGGEPPLPGDGAGLYNVFCAICHGAGGRGGKFKAVTGTPASMISSAINDEAWMDTLALTNAQINSIATYLIAGGSGPTPVSGDQVYAVYCAVCHGADGRGGTYKVVTGSSQAFINSAINNQNLMSQLSLSSQQLQSVAGYLAAGGGGNKPVTGAGLYLVYCETCHGPNGNGGPEENVRGESTSKINSAINGESKMRHLQPYLTQSGANSDTALISEFLRQ